MKICPISELSVARYNGSPEVRCKCKKCYGEGEPENVNLALVQQAHRPARACKLVRFMHQRIGPSMEISENSELPVPGTMVAPRQGVYEKEATGKESLEM